MPFRTILELSSCGFNIAHWKRHHGLHIFAWTCISLIIHEKLNKIDKMPNIFQSIGPLVLQIGMNTNCGMGILIINLQTYSGVLLINYS